MKKKTPASKKSKRAPAEPEKRNHKPEPEEAEKFDFGGLPNINLKKNLGCG